MRLPALSRQPGVCYRAREGIPPGGAHLKLALAVAVTLAAITVGLTPRRVALREMLWWAGAVGLAGGALVAPPGALWAPGERSGSSSGGGAATTDAAAARGGKRRESLLF